MCTAGVLKKSEAVIHGNGQVRIQAPDRTGFRIQGVAALLFRAGRFEKRCGILVAVTLRGRQG